MEESDTICICREDQIPDNVRWYQQEDTYRDMEAKSKPQKKTKELLTSLDFVMFIVIEFHEFKVGPLITNSNKWNVPYFQINQDYSASLSLLPVCLKVMICQTIFSYKTLKVVRPWRPPSAPTLPETHWGRSDQSTKRLLLRYRPLEEGTKI